MQAACGFLNKRDDSQVDGPVTPQLIWDLPTRVYHWLLVVCVLGIKGAQREQVGD